jgi:hypothetical protein
MSHKAKGLSRNGCRNKKGLLSLGSYQAAKNSLFREARSQKQRLHICYLISEYPDIVTVKLTIKEGCFVF